MKMLATVASAAFLLFGINGHARADECHSAKELIDYLSISSPNYWVDVIALVKGDTGRQLVAEFNAKPPASNIIAESVIFLQEIARPTNRPNGVYFIVLMHDGCVASFDRIPADDMRQLLGQGA